MHMLVTLSDLELTGETDEGEYVQPSSVTAKQVGCAKCKGRIYAVNDRLSTMAGLRVGTLDCSKEMEPAAHLWTKSKQSWVRVPNDVPVLEEAPKSDAEWFQLLGPDQ